MSRVSLDFLVSSRNRCREKISLNKRGGLSVIAGPSAEFGKKMGGLKMIFTVISTQSICSNDSFLKRVPQNQIRLCWKIYQEIFKHPKQFLFSPVYESVF